jgi:protease PrsW
LTVDAALGRVVAASPALPVPAPAQGRWDGPMRLVTRRTWLALLAVGALLWILATAVTAVTEDTILVPTVILLGSFLIPVTMVLFALSQAGETELTPQALAGGFLLAGGLGVVFSAFAET